MLTNEKAGVIWLNLSDPMMFCNESCTKWHAFMLSQMVEDGDMQYTIILSYKQHVYNMLING